MLTAFGELVLGFFFTPLVFLRGVLVAKLPRSTARRLVVEYVLLALAVCWSRPYLGYHYPGDLLAGTLAAVAWVSGCLIGRHHALRRLAARSQLVAAGLKRTAGQ